MSAGPVDQGCALVTGASRGIGAAIARALATDGWSVAINYRTDDEGARSVAAEIAASGGRALEIQADVADEGSVQRMFDSIEGELGPALVLVNNAGTRHDRLLQGLSTQEWTRVIATNLHGTYQTMRRAIGPMIHQRFGRIVNISSISAARPQPAQASYAASKAAVEALTRTVAQEVGRRGVTVNAVAPGLVDTAFIPDALRSPAALKALPARRLGEPDEVAAVARFLCSREAGYISGTVITMDGGFTAGLGTGGQYWPPKAEA